MKTVKGGTTKNRKYSKLLYNFDNDDRGYPFVKRTWGIGWYNNLLYNNHKEKVFNDNNDMNNEENNLAIM